MTRTGEAGQSNGTRSSDGATGSERRVIMNPTSGTGEHASEVRQLAERWGYSVDETEHAGHAVTLAADAVAAGVKVLAACGGDGTLREVIQGLRKAEALDDVRVGVIPAGTANIVAADLGIESIEHGFEVLETGERRDIDLGIADDDVFVKSCIAGLTADASAATTSDVKARFGPLAFVITGIQQARSFAPLDLHIEAVTDDEEWTWSGSAVCVLVGNTRRFANRIGQANVEDSLFDVTLVEEMPSSDLVTEAIGQQLLGRDTEHVTRMNARRLTVVGTEAAIDFSLDGEIHTADRLDLRVLPGALSVRVGAEYDPTPTE